MAYITSRPYHLPMSAKELARRVWFNMWERRYWPYRELVRGDVLYWYERPSKRLVWETRVSAAVQFPYATKREALGLLRRNLGKVYKDDPYYVQAPKSGYCLGFKVVPLKQLNLTKPATFRFPQLGWHPADWEFSRLWLRRRRLPAEPTLDDVVAKCRSLEDLLRLNAEMAEVSPRRIETLGQLRQDARIVRVLKKLCDFRCQFPGCGARIPKERGGFYIEVHHIKPVRSGGRSVLGNLVVLCPNHHKEFDLGNPTVYEQTITRVRGRLNGKEFDISLPGVPG